MEHAALVNSGALHLRSLPEILKVSGLVYLLNKGQNSSTFENLPAHRSQDAAAAPACRKREGGREGGREERSNRQLPRASIRKISPARQRNCFPFLFNKISARALTVESSIRGARGIENNSLIHIFIHYIYYIHHI